MVSLLDKILIAVLTLIFMVGMGTTMTRDDWRRVAAHPRALGIGLAAQFGWTPLLGWLAIHAFELTGPAASGLLLMACLSGGTASNMFAYFARADLALSVAMTTLSTLVAVIATPLLLAIYMSALGDTRLPLIPVAATLAAMLLPIALGMWLRTHAAHTAQRVERAGSVAGVGLLALLLITNLRDQRELLTQNFGPPMLACASVSGLAMLLGYVAARVGCLNQGQRRAVAFETGIQNAPLALAVVITTFPAEEQQAIIQLPLLYAMLALMIGSVVTVWVRLIDRPQDTAQ